MSFSTSQYVSAELIQACTMFRRDRTEAIEYFDEETFDYDPEMIPDNDFPTFVDFLNAYNEQRNDKPLIVVTRVLNELSELGEEFWTANLSPISLLDSEVYEFYLPKQ